MMTVLHSEHQDVPMRGVGCYAPEGAYPARSPISGASTRGRVCTLHRPDAGGPVLGKAHRRRQCRWDRDARSQGRGCRGRPARRRGRHRRAGSPRRCRDRRAGGVGTGGGEAILEGPVRCAELTLLAADPAKQTEWSLRPPTPTRQAMPERGVMLATVVLSAQIPIGIHQPRGLPAKIRQLACPEAICRQLQSSAGSSVVRNRWR